MVSRVLKEGEDIWDLAGTVLSDSVLTLAVTSAFLFVPKESQRPDFKVLTKHLRVHILHFQESRWGNTVLASISFPYVDSGTPPAGCHVPGWWPRPGNVGWGRHAQVVLCPWGCGLSVSFPPSIHSPLTLIHFCCIWEGKCWEAV